MGVDNRDCPESYYYAMMFKLYISADPILLCLLNVRLCDLKISKINSTDTSLQRRDYDVYSQAFSSYRLKIQMRYKRVTI